MACLNGQTFYYSSKWICEIIDLCTKKKICTWKTYSKICIWLAYQLIRSVEVDGNRSDWVAFADWRCPPFLFLFPFIFCRNIRPSVRHKMLPAYSFGILCRWTNSEGWSKAFVEGTVPSYREVKRTDEFWGFWSATMRKKRSRKSTMITNMAKTKITEIWLLKCSGEFQAITKWVNETLLILLKLFIFSINFWIFLVNVSVKMKI